MAAWAQRQKGNVTRKQLLAAPRALLSHRTAGRLWRLPGTRYPELEVTVVGRRVRPQPGLRIYSLNALAPHELRRQLPAKRGAGSSAFRLCALDRAMAG